jgi:hypothetical protein
MQHGQICCCFHQAAVELPHSCNSGWSTSPPTRCSVSVLYTAHRPMRLAQQSTMLLLWEVALLPQPCSQCLFLTLFALAEFGYSGRLASHTTPTVRTCSSHCPAHRVWLPVPPLFSEVGLVFYPVPIASGRLQFTVYVFQFC